MYAIVVTFVFSVYLTGSVGEGMPGGASPGELAGPGAGHRRAHGRGAGAGDRGVGAGPALAAPGVDGVDRGGGRC